MRDRGCDCPEAEPGSWTGKHFKECSVEHPWKSAFLEHFRREGKLMGNGEGYTVLVLTDAESRLIRERLTPTHTDPVSVEAISAYNRGIQRATERIAAEFAEEQKRRKASK